MKSLEQSQKDYQSLHEISRHARVLQGITALLDWDQETYMPPGAAENRAEQFKVMAGLVHRERTSPKFKNALQKLVDIESGHVLVEGLTYAQKAALREWRRDYLIETALSSKFVEEFAQLTSQSIVAWRNAKQENNFQLFAPYLEKLMHMSRQKADFLGYEKHPYDALLDHYEPGITSEEVNNLFVHIRTHLSPLIKKIKSAPQVNDKFLFGAWDRDKQIAFSHRLLDAMGYNKNYGRLDFSSHPFSSSSHPTDSRITTRMETKSIIDNIFVVLHEGGHGLYEMGLPQDQYGTPLGDSRSLGIHESQSRWWETRMGMSLPFWKYYLPLLKETFKGLLDTVTVEEFYRAINKVEPAFIRVDADELTYPLHVILRFELEKDLIEGVLSVRDLPDAWNAKMEEYLGIIPPTNKQGCLQDIHWAMGGIGYFPTYTLGNLFAAHLFNGFAIDHPDWSSRVEAGDLSFVKLWLHEKVFKHGKEYRSLELIEKATGKPFSADPYIHYLKQKYTQIYKV